MPGGVLGTVSGQVRLDVRQAVAAYAMVRAQNARTVYALRGAGDSFVGAGKVMGAAGLGLVAVFGKAVTSAAEFERKMDFFGAVTDTNAAKMRKLSDYTLQLATDTIYSADQIAEGFIELGKAGVNADQIIRGIGQAMANLGAAGDIPLAESGQIITSTIQQFDLSARDAVKVVDLLAGAANASIADITDIGVSLKYVGGVANAAGLNFEDTATAISLLAKAGIRGSTAGTSLRQMIVSLGGATGPATEQLKELGIIAEDGSNKFFDAQGNAKSLSEVFQILQTHTADLTNKERLMALRTIFNNRALAAASILTRDGAKGFREMNKEMSKTSAAEVASKRLDNLSGDLEILRGNIETLFIRGGSPFQDTVRGWVQSLTNLLKAFGDLDPATQKTIFQTIGMTGAILTAMGAFSIILGTIFRFAASMYKMGAAIVFVVKFLRGFLFLLGLITGGAVGPFLLIAAAVIAIGAAFVIAYKKITPFREWVNSVGSSFMNNFVNPIVSGLKVVGKWLGLLIKNPGAAWDQLQNAATKALSQIGEWLGKLPGLAAAGLGKLGALAGQAIMAVVGWFLSLPGRVLGALTGFVAKVASLFTFRNVGALLGLFVQMVVNRFITLPALILTALLRLSAVVWRVFGQLGQRAAFLVGFMIGRILLLMGKLALAMGRLALRGVMATIRFFQQLPGRVGAFIGNTVSRGISLFNKIATSLPRIAAQAVSNVIKWVSDLPGRVGTFMANTVNRARTALSKLPSVARNAALSLFNGFMGIVGDLPGTVGRVVGNLIDAFRGAIRSAYEAAKDFAGGLWDGFKKGLGISSPSFIERAAFSMNKTMVDETKKLADQTMAIQKIGKKYASMSFSLGDLSGPSGVNALAMSQAMNRKRIETLMGGREGRPTSITLNRNGSDTSRLVDGELRIDPSGRAFIRGVAEDTYETGYEFDDDLERMG